MRIKWQAVVALALVITLIVLLIKLGPIIGTLADDIDALSGTGGDPTIGLMALGIVCVTAVSIFVVLIRRW